MKTNEKTVSGIQLREQKIFWRGSIQRDLNLADSILLLLPIQRNYFVDYPTTINSNEEQIKCQHISGVQLLKLIKIQSKFKSFEVAKRFDAANVWQRSKYLLLKGVILLVSHLLRLKMGKFAFSLAYASIVPRYFYLNQFTNVFATFANLTICKIELSM